ncbi:MAG: restriction endonuclease subunit S [Burkholderiaceae bacterium]|nr:restriction endonuclease subunit S [Burkholderiaceae bacterium]
MNSKTKTSAIKEEATPAVVPRLRFPEFRRAKGWKEVALGEIADVKLGKMLDKQKHTTGLLLPYLNNISVRWNEVDTSNLPQMYFDDDELDRFGLRAGDVVVCEGGEPGRSAVWDGRLPDLKFQKAIHRVRFKIPFQPRLLVLHLENLAGTTRFEKLFTGGGIKHLTGETFARLKIPLIPCGEQQKIAECLSSVDELMAAQVRKVDVLKTHKKGLMQQLFPSEGVTQPRLRFPEFQKAGEWVKMTFGQAATFYNGRAYKQEELLESGKYPVLRVGNFFTSNTWYYSDLELDETKYCGSGDLLYAWSASFGPRVWRGEKSIYHYHIWKVVEQPGIDRQFLFMALENETENMKAKTTNGLGIMHITKGAIESWESSFPTMAEQRKISDCLTSLDNTIIAEIEKLDTLKTQKDGLMQQLFPSSDAIQL